MPTNTLAAVERPSAPRDPQSPPQQPGKAAHDLLQDAPVEQQRGQGRHHQHHRQGLEGEDEARARPVLGEGQQAAAEIVSERKLIILKNGR